MSDFPKATIRIRVEPTNPGQFFACCGLLELADRLWPRSAVRGAFNAKHFELLGEAEDFTLKHLLEQFVTAEVSELDPPGKVDSPLLLGSPFHLRLDWWRKIETKDKKRIDVGGGDKLKTWSGKQFGPLIFRLMKCACKDIDIQSPLDSAQAVYDQKAGKDNKKTISPFYFDSRREGTSLDIGFSPDEQNMSVMAYPAVESLALVGLQRFRPSVDEGDSARTFLYTLWTDPLPPVLAMAAVSGMIPVRSCGRYRFNKPSRGGEYATMFSRATRENSNSV